METGQQSAENLSGGEEVALKEALNEETAADQKPARDRSLGYRYLNAICTITAANNIARDSKKKVGEIILHAVSHGYHTVEEGLNMIRESEKRVDDVRIFFLDQLADTALDNHPTELESIVDFLESSPGKSFLSCTTLIKETGIELMKNWNDAVFRPLDPLIQKLKAEADNKADAILKKLFGEVLGVDAKIVSDNSTG